MQALRVFTRRVQGRRFLSSASKGNVLEELKERGFISQMSSKHEFLELMKTPQTVYLGFDPTADSLHLGNLVTLMALSIFQRHGHRPLCLVTHTCVTVSGDPSGRSTERNMLDVAEVNRNAEGISNTLKRFVDFTSPTNPAKLVNNIHWYQGMNMISFLRDVGKHFRVSSMLAKDSVQSRLKTTDESPEGMSFTEFTYQALQAYDFWYLYKTEGCRVQIGGNDQWGNITAGFDLAHKITAGRESLYGLTVPLLTTSSGEKFGKSAGNAIWLDDRKTSPYQLYQYFFNSSDGDVIRYLKLFTQLPLEEIQALEGRHDADRSQRTAQKKLAEEVTKLVHGFDGLQQVARAT